MVLIFYITNYHLRLMSFRNSYHNFYCFSLFKIFAYVSKFVSFFFKNYTLYSKMKLCQVIYLRSCLEIFFLRSLIIIFTLVQAKSKRNVARNSYAITEMKKIICFLFTADIVNRVRYEKTQTAPIKILKAVACI